MARILVVDDEEDIRASLRDLLGMLPGAQVEVASTFAEGRSKAAAGPWDVVVSDERLPDGRGVDVLAESFRANPQATRVLMSAFHDFDALLRGVNAAHIDHFIQKPWDPDDVLRWMEQALKDRAWPLRELRAGPFRRLGTVRG